MTLEAGCKIQVKTEAETPLVMILRPISGAAQSVLASSLTIDPAVPIREFTDAYGNASQRLTLAAGSYTMVSSCSVSASDALDVNPSAGFTPIRELPDDVLPYLLPSRYCPSDVMGDLAIKVTRKAAPGYGQAEAIRRWIEQRFKYQYGISTSSTSALDTVRKRKGVCRDFSHVGIALCRALLIPARMVFGYLYQLEPMDLHAWYEAFVGGRWYAFDATQKVPRGNRIVIAYGRDAVDVAQISQYGPLMVERQEVWVRQAS